jgi:prepilin-type N-terminal cleavage/methylation domain-containing protein
MTTISRDHTKRVNTNKRAFTLIEAVVVIALLAILSTLTYPLLNVTNSGSDDQARGTVDQALAIAASVYQRTTAMPTTTAAITKADNDMQFVGATTVPSNSGEVSIGINSTHTVFGAASPGLSGLCWMVSWSINDTSPTLDPTLYASELSTTPGFSCDAASALELATCPATATATGASWTSLLLCDLSV